MQPRRKVELPPESSTQGAWSAQDIETELIRQVGPAAFEHWFRPHTACHVQQDELVVELQSPFLQSWLIRKYKSEITAAAQALLGPGARIRIEVRAHSESANRSAVQAESPSQGATRSRVTVPGHAQPVRTESVRLQSRTPLDPDVSERGPAGQPLAAVVSTAEEPSPQTGSAPKEDPVSRTASAPVSRSAVTASRRTSPARSGQSAQPGLPAARPEPGPRPGRRFSDLSQFVIGRGNELAATACRQMCESPDNTHTLLYLYGGVGTGKTHLLEGIYRRLRAEHRALQVTYLTAENFANFFTEALRQHALPTFRQRFRTIDLLIVDDVNFLDGKPSIQEEFLHTLSTLISHGRSVVLSADRHPRMLLKTSVELQSRMLAGMVCRLEAPDLETRRAILQRKAERLGGEFTPEALDYVAGRFTANVRELEGALYSLKNYQLATGRKVGITAAREALGDLERDCIRVVRLADIDRTVSSLFGLDQDLLRSAERSRSVTQPRMLAMYLARQLTSSAYSEIGAYFGGRNHSTVISAEKKIDALQHSQETWTVAARAWTVGDLVATLREQLLAS